MAKRTTARIHIRAYDVGFGDCVLVRMPAGGRTANMLVDFGRAPGKGGTTAVFPAIAEDIERLCGGHLDVLVMSHEHLDHMEGFYHQRAVFGRMKVDHVWMSLPSDPTYYSRYTNAEPQRRLRALLDQFAANARGSGLALAPSFEAVLENNLSNADRVSFLRNLTGAQVHYLARDGRDRRLPPFEAGAVRVLAPEPDVSIYYGRGAKRSLAAFARRVGDGDEVTPERRDPWTFPGVRRVPVPENLSAADWRRLREAHEGQADAVRLIDRAANNTSLCFILEVAGKRLMFPGDAELESWEVMAERGVLDGPIDFLKVSHHGSHNGTPLGPPLDTLLPRSRRRQSKVLVSTRRDVYGIHNPVPDDALLDELRKRATVYTTEDAVDGHVDIYLDATTDAAPRSPRRPGRRAAEPVAQPGDGTPHGNPFDLARRRTPRPAARPGGARPLNSGEHVWIGSLGAQLACRQEKLDGTRFESLPRRHAEDRLSYGELVALSGDFYGSPSELYEEQPAALPWLWEPNDLDDLRDMFRAELDWIASDGKSPYPDFNVRMAWNAKSFLELALANADHFGWHNMAAYCRFHAAALELAKRAQGRDGETWVRAIYYNAYADHFLTDGFAAGHIRVPRAQIRAWALGRGYSDKLGGALSKLLHDQDGHIGTLHADHNGQTEGLRVANARGDAWDTRCDGQLFLRNGHGDPTAAPAVQIPVQAVAASVGELLRAWRHGALPDGAYAATAFVAFPHPETKPLEQKFSVKAWSKKRLDELVANVQWYSKVPWIGPGVNRDNIVEMFETLPELMKQFRATVKADQERNAMLHRRVAPEYLAAYADIR